MLHYEILPFWIPVFQRAIMIQNCNQSQFPQDCCPIKTNSLEHARTKNIFKDFTFSLSFFFFKVMLLLPHTYNRSVLVVFKRPIYFKINCYIYVYNIYTIYLFICSLNFTWEHIIVNAWVVHVNDQQDLETQLHCLQNGALEKSQCDKKVIRGGCRAQLVPTALCNEEEGNKRPEE